MAIRLTPQILVPVTPYSGGVNLFDVETFPDQLIPILTSFLSGFDKINLERTCRRFHSLSTPLYEATEKLVAFLVTFSLTSEQKRAIVQLNPSAAPGLNMRARKELDAFYPLFKKRILELHVAYPGKTYSDQILLFSAHAVNPHFPSDEEKELSEKSIRFEVCLGLTKRYSEDLITAYATQPIRSFTLANFKITCSFLSTGLGNLRHPLAALLRQAIKREHPTAEIEAVRREYLDTAPDAPRYLAAKEEIKHKPTQEKESLKSEIPHFQLKLDASAPEVQRAEKEMNQSFDALLEHCPLIILGNREQMMMHFLKHVQLLAVDEPPMDLVEKFKAKHEDYGSKKRERESLYASRIVLVNRWVALSAVLQPGAIDKSAKALFTKMAQFLGELNQDITAENSELRYRAMRTIIEKK